MTRIEFNVQTGEKTVITLSSEEEAGALALQAAWDAENTLDAKAIRTVDALDRLQFEHLFDLENRARVLEAKLPITRAQYRNTLIERWKALHAT